MYTIDYFVNMYLETFPTEKEKVDEHIKLNGIFLGHIFFDEEIGDPLCRMLRSNHSEIEIKKLVNIIETMLFEGDEYVQSVVTLNIIKKIKKEKDLIEKARLYFNDKTIEFIQSEWQMSLGYN